MIYAKAVRELYEEQKAQNISVDVGEIGRNGSLIAGKLSNMVFESKNSILLILHKYCDLIFKTDIHGSIPFPKRQRISIILKDIFCLDSALLISGILGFNISMGEDRQSKGSYSVYYFKRDEECKQAEYTATLKNCSSHCLIKIFDFTVGQKIVFYTHFIIYG